MRTRPEPRAEPKPSQFWPRNSGLTPRCPREVRSGCMRPGPTALALVGVLLGGRQAFAWQIADPIHKDCHERLTQAALDGTGYVAPPPELTGDDARLRENVDFDASRYDANI